MRVGAAETAHSPIRAFPLPHRAAAAAVVRGEARASEAVVAGR